MAYTVQWPSSQYRVPYAISAMRAPASMNPTPPGVRTMRAAYSSTPSASSSRMVAMVGKHRYLPDAAVLGASSKLMAAYAMRTSREAAYHRTAAPPAPRAASARQQRADRHSEPHQPARGGATAAGGSMPSPSAAAASTSVGRAPGRVAESSFAANHFSSGTLPSAGGAVDGAAAAAAAPPPMAGASARMRRHVTAAATRAGTAERGDVCSSAWMASRTSTMFHVTNSHVTARYEKLYDWLTCPLLEVAFTVSPLNTTASS